MLLCMFVCLSAEISNAVIQYKTLSMLLYMFVLSRLFLFLADVAHAVIQDRILFLLVCGLVWMFGCVPMSPMQ